MSNTPASTVQQPEEPTPIQTSALIDEQARKSAMFTVFLVVFIDLLASASSCRCCRCTHEIYLCRSCHIIFRG